MRDQSRLDAVDFVGARRQLLLDVRGGVEMATMPSAGALPHVLVRHLGHGDVELASRSLTRRSTMRLSLSDSAYGMNSSTSAGRRA